MGKNTVYTFRGPRKKHSQSMTQPNLYTPTENYNQESSVEKIYGQESNEDSSARYIRYTFFMSFFIFCLILVGFIYIYLKGLPVKVRM